MKEYKEKTISLNGDRRLINACKKAGLVTFNPQGEWNGYGYERLCKAVRIKSLGDMRKFNKIIKECEEKKNKAPAPKTPVQKEEVWARRLSKLTGISYEDAMEIAAEKINAKYEEINKLVDRQNNERYSKKRAVLIRQIERSNPLRRITDTEHANRILNASNRHRNTDYEYYFEELHQMEEEGMPRGYAKALAKMLTSGEITIDEVQEYFYCPDILLSNYTKTT